METKKEVIGRLAERRYQKGDQLPEVGTECLVSCVNCDVESDQHRSYYWRKVIGYANGFDFVCLQTADCWPTVERTENCWFAEIPAPIYALSAQHTGVPDGWKLVPIEPTEAMCHAAVAEAPCIIKEHYRGNEKYTGTAVSISSSMFAECYNSMLAATPPAPLQAAVVSEGWRTPVDQKMWTLIHNGQAVCGNTIMDVLRLGRGIRTEAERVTAATNLYAALEQYRLEQLIKRRIIDNPEIDEAAKKITTPPAPDAGKVKIAPDDWRLDAIEAALIDYSDEETGHERDIAKRILARMDGWLAEGGYETAPDAQAPAETRRDTL